MLVYQRVTHVSPCITMYQHAITTKPLVNLLVCRPTLLANVSAPMDAIFFWLKSNEISDICAAIYGNMDPINIPQSC